MVMTVDEIFDQAKSLSKQEQEELANLLNQLLHESQNTKSDEPTEHWGKSLNRLMDEIGPIEMKYPEIEDPVEWVMHLRSEENRRRLGDWGDEE